MLFDDDAVNPHTHLDVEYKDQAREELQTLLR